MFLRLQAPHHGLTATGGHAGGRRRCATGPGCGRSARTGCGTPRPRHAAAGAPLTEIGQVLRHARQLTTAIYAKVDTTRAAALARPWPGGARMTAIALRRWPTTWRCAGRLGYKLARPRSAADRVHRLSRRHARPARSPRRTRWPGPRCPTTPLPCWCGTRLRGGARFRRATCSRSTPPPRSRRRAAARQRPARDALPVFRRRDRRADDRRDSRCGPRCARPPIATLIGLLAVTGMRLGEVDRAWTDADVDPGDGVLTIRRRQVRQEPAGPAAPQHRRARWPTTPPARPVLSRARARPALLISTAGTRLIDHNVAHVFARLVRRPGWRPLGRVPAPAARPPAHLRRAHPARLVPRRRRRRRPGCRCCRPTSGHVDPANTYWYLSAVPELLALAADRLETAAGRSIGDERARPDPAGVLHRAAHPPAPGQPAHRRRLPRHLPAAARASRSTRTGNQPCHARTSTDLDATLIAAFLDHLEHERRQQRAHPQRPPGRDPLAVPLRRAAPPRARRLIAPRARHPRQTRRPRRSSPTSPTPRSTPCSPRPTGPPGPGDVTTPCSTSPSRPGCVSPS